MKPEIKQGSEHVATARSSNLPISTKHSVELARFIRGKPVEKVKKLLNLVLEKKVAVPYKRYDTHIAHKSTHAITPPKYATTITSH